MFTNFINQQESKPKTKKSDELAALEWLNEYVFDGKFSIVTRTEEFDRVAYRYLSVWYFRIFYVRSIFGYVIFRVTLSYEEKGFILTKMLETPKNIEGILNKFLDIVDKCKLTDQFVKNVKETYNDPHPSH